ncbi:hypothetical protein B5X24_HaOG211236 [Helicoverpa armigera]|uniref:Uncharacterized protein n=1 Tax=Helicoverpa armigera TaxID=29058 RepID=A0A2W1BL73_HELAM|nr:hypothetical protein B5X24_HaOG211236 [Helicoverpa armigera]
MTEVKENFLRRRKADKAPELIAQAHVYGGWVSSLDHTEGDDGIPVLSGPWLEPRPGCEKSPLPTASTRTRGGDLPGQGHSGPSVQWPEPHFKEGTFRYYYALC